jgi:hypothetical protein
MLVSYISAGLLLVSSALTVQARYIDYNVAASPALYRRENPGCKNMNTNFAETTEGWVLQRGSTEETYDITPDGLQMKILKPSEYNSKYEALTDNNTPEST